VAPLAHANETATILTSLGWPVEPHSTDWRPVNRAYVTSFAVAAIPPALLALAIPFMGSAGLTVVAALPFLGVLAALWIVIAPVAIAMRWFSWRRTRYALGNETLFVETGWWRHRRNIVPTRKVQSVDLAENFWSRAFGICTLRLGIAGGSGFSDHHVPALTRAEAEALRAELLS